MIPLSLGRIHIDFSKDGTSCLMFSRWIQWQSNTGRAPWAWLLWSYTETCIWTRQSILPLQLMERKTSFYGTSHLVDTDYEIWTIS